MRMCLGCGVHGPTTMCPTCRLGVVDYERTHQRLAVVLGTATKHTCACGTKATQWAYNNSCAREKADSRGRRYCPHSYCYDALCYGCHRTMDADRRASER